MASIPSLKWVTVVILLFLMMGWVTEALQNHNVLSSRLARGVCEQQKRYLETHQLQPALNFLPKSVKNRANQYLDMISFQKYPNHHFEEIPYNGHHRRLAEEDQGFFLHTKKSPTTKVFTKFGVPFTPSSLVKAKFNPKDDIIVLVHGWRSAADDKWVNNIVAGYLKRVQGTTVITVDWSNWAGSLIYGRSVGRFEKVGWFVADMLQMLVTGQGVGVKKFHLIGHSLGAHIMGLAARAFKIRTKNSIRRITGLDPAKQCFESFGILCPEFKVRKLYPHLTKDDADFVDIIHTDTNKWGYDGALGHVDFYPHGGSAQPGCGFIIPSPSCSHARATLYYEESIGRANKFQSLQCDNWKNYVHRRCQSNQQLGMGAHAEKGVNIMGARRFYCDVEGESPFSQS